MDKKGLVPAIVGLTVGLAVLYLTVRVVSAGWKAGK